jgi:hypothetical protein
MGLQNKFSMFVGVGMRNDKRNKRRISSNDRMKQEMHLKYDS